MNRLDSLMKNLPEDIDGTLLTSKITRLYYTDFPSSAGVILATREKSYLIIDSRYFEAAQASIKSCQVILQDKVYQQLGEIIKKHNLKNIAIESNTLSIKGLGEYKEKLADVNFVSDNRLSDLIENQRAVKSQAEISSIQKAQDITDQSFDYILGKISAGMSEKEVALELEFYSRKIGSQEPAFAFIVVSGAKSSLPHGVPDDSIIKKGDFIVMDFGATYNGYRSDMSRTIAVGSVSEKQRRVYQTVLESQLKAMELIKAGQECVEVDNAARSFIETADNGSYKGLFGHGLGHSLGLEIHEDPRFSPASQAVLKEGMVMSVEPGIYLPGEFGVRIEDIVCVTSDGYYNFAKSPKELCIV